MQWFLHVGTEKTGSSHLQCQLALSRDYLEENGLCFPPGWPYDEKCMRSGNISAGNARQLAKALSGNDQQLARELIDVCVDYAHTRKVEKIILASEWLLEPLSQPGGIRQLVDLLEERSCFSLSLLLVLRDPLSQCLSLYRHRAKRGTAGDIQSWLADGYRLSEQLSLFREQVEVNGIALCVRKYLRGSEALERLFFEDWLEIKRPRIELTATVNPSLTMSEVALIRKMAQIRSDLTLPLYESLLAVPSDQKIGDGALEYHAREVAAGAVAAYSNEWQAWNALLPQGEQLEIPEAPDVINEPPTELKFSEAQLEAISALFARAATPGFVLETFWRSRLRPGLGRLARGVGFRR